MSTSAATGPPLAARAVLAALGVPPVKLFVVGGIGSGKSTVLEAVRRHLRESGRQVVSRPSAQGDAAAAVVVDDAHLLPVAALHELAQLTDDPDRIVVVAAEGRDHDPELRELGAALEREHPRITLGPLPTSEISRLLSDSSGRPPSADLLSTVVAATQGIPLLVTAAERALRRGSPAAPAQAVDYALHERLHRLDPLELEALLIASLSTDLGVADLAATTGAPTARAAQLLDRAVGTGLVQPSHTLEFRRAVHLAAAQVIGATRHHELESALLRTQLEASTLPDAVALELAEHGTSSNILASWMAQRARAIPHTAELTERIRWYRGAVSAGATDLQPLLADSLALSGECASAAMLSDALLGASSQDQRAAGVRIAASVATHDANTGYAAELFGWLGPHPDALVGSAAAIVHFAAGDLRAAHEALDAARTGPPTTAARAARSLAEGLLSTVGGTYPAAATTLGQAVSVEHGIEAVMMPDSAPALVTLAAIHSGDSVRARSVISRAVRAGANPAFSARNRLLQGWVRMLDGQLSSAAVDAEPAFELHGRDALWAAALRTAVARRAGDMGALSTNWFAAMDVLAEYSIDLFCLLPLGELWVAAARLRQQERLTATLEQAFGLLKTLGDPPTWAALLHWSGVHAGILAGDPAAVAPHGQALAAIAEGSSFAAALAVAGRTWLQVLAGQVAPEAVISSARALARFGLTSDATRLAGQAALQAQDPKVSALMLQVARDLKLGADGEVPIDPSETESATRRRPATTTTLSEREREVAELLLLGMPYRDIGAQLFISAKTVEHHVARIRRRLGANSRPEMLSMLRAMLGPIQSSG